MPALQPRELWDDYVGETVYGRTNVPITREVILDTWVGDVSGEFLPAGASVDVVELTSDHLAVEWNGRTLFLLFRGDEPGDSLRDQIERTFTPDPSATDLQSIAPDRRSLIRSRRVIPGMTPVEVRTCWGPPPRVLETGDASGLVWLYPAGGAFHHEITFVNNRVVRAELREGDGPLIPDPYPARTPRRKRPYLPW